MAYIKPIMALLVSVCFFQFLSAQNSYNTHMLKQGETLSALAKQYNTSVGDIMRVNGMHADTKLVYGSKIKIPLAKKQTIVTPEKETIIPDKEITLLPAEATKHTVAKGETLYSISKKYKVSMEQLQAWNHLTEKSVKLGTVLIVGNNKNESIVTKKQRAETIAATENKNEFPVTVNKQNTEVAIQTKTAAKQTEVKPENQAAEQQTETSANIAETTQLYQQTNSNYSGTGFFEDQFVKKNTKHKQDISGVSKTFKTASGWTDGKYYILADNIEPGTIVKIKADNGNEVYAKVLWNMGDLKDNAGINFRVSNAAAAALHEDASSFNLSVSF